MISTLMTFKQLEALVWVADLGSFRRAAAHLNTTQPNISARIAGLEQALDLVLMHRDAGSVRLSERGAAIVSQARTVLRAAEDLRDMAGRADLVADKMRLGVTELVACTWLHDYLRALKQAYPGMAVELTVDLSRNLARDLADHAFDLTLQNGPVGVAAPGHVPLGDCPYVFVAPPDLGLGNAAGLSVPDLIPHTLLTHARHTQAFAELSRHIQSAGFSPARLVASSSLASCVQMALDGLGVAMLPHALVAREIGAGGLQQLDVDWAPAPLAFAARFPADRAPGHIARAAAIAARICATSPQAGADPDGRSWKRDDQQR